MSGAAALLTTYKAMLPRGPPLNCDLSATGKGKVPAGQSRPLVLCLAGIAPAGVWIGVSQSASLSPIPVIAAAASRRCDRGELRGLSRKRCDDAQAFLDCDVVRAAADGAGCVVPRANRGRRAGVGLDRDHS